MYKKPVVYISGPITGSGNFHENIRNGMMTWHDLVYCGFSPICPHMQDFAYFTTGSIDWQTAIEVDLSLVAASNAVLRLPGKSKGADVECALAKKLRIPVFEEIDELYEVFKNTLEVTKWPLSANA